MADLEEAAVAYRRAHGQRMRVATDFRATTVGFVHAAPGATMRVVAPRSTCFPCRCGRPLAGPGAKLPNETVRLGPLD